MSNKGQGSQVFNLLWNKKVQETINSPQLCGHWTLKYLPNHGSHSRDTAAVFTSAANRLIGEVVQSQRRPLLGPSPG